MMSALFSALDDRRLAEAVILVRTIRARWPDGEFGTDEDEDVEVLLGALCRHRATVKPGGKTETAEKKTRPSRPIGATCGSSNECVTNQPTN